jgi:ribonuclease BN (tRNA processing enzyme)
VSPKPQSVAVRMYQVGFGDCFLVSFSYARPLEDGRSERHMLVDFGSTHGPKGSRRGGRPIVAQAADLIAKDTGGTLDVVVLTHRHRDHLSGFGDEEAAKVIRGLHPKLVARPWTEHPDLPRDAEAPLGDGTADGNVGFAQHLAAGHRLAARIRTITQDARADSAQGRLARLALDQVPNPKAIAFLDELADTTDGEYLSEGMASRIPQQIPGIGVRVLGPPTIEQHAAIMKARANDPDEFWLTQLGEVEHIEPASLDTNTRRPPPERIEPGPVAWIVEKLAHQQVGVLNRIVRTVDDALNNTSLILLIDAGDKRLLLPGDAQIENWSWALQDAPKAGNYRRLLTSVDLYKVGHHGSRNATPKSLFRLWEQQSRNEHPMVALMSTMPDVHGKTEATAVPRGSLVTALGLRMDLVRTDDLEERESVTVAAPCRGKVPFAIQPEGS